ncbi:hypothetical protein JZK55_08860 [Dissulfurispira thermophila]|uniref:Uncharacterized protein n=1 Tax=Dissulfurispira thermophila TaxID=2715679 RepID=A0A7G1GZX6_9BACT|nr:hypothetical protein [Dissulfurispira thermophila]BCB95964.1 hypothetical protein JZK55_08860 [Dissulfurispira thermophila]
MPEAIEQKTYEFKADPFAFVFRELDIIHREIIELKTDIKELDKKFDKKIDEKVSEIDKKFGEVNKRIDKLYLFVIATLIGTLGSLIKLLFF